MTTGETSGDFESREIDMWKPIEDAPKDGTLIVGLYEDGEEDLIQWRDSRQCILASVAHGAGQRGPGWASALCDFLPVDPPTAWKPQDTTP